MLGWLCSLPLVAQIILFIVLLLVIVKIYINVTMGVCKSKNRLDGKTVIITGANTGIGKETALDLAGRGAKVILACRDLQKANKAKDEIVSETGNSKVIVKKLDLSSLKSVRQFAAEIIRSESRLDILVNNAGCAGLEKKLTEDGLEYQMASNYFGHFLLTNLLLGLLFKSKQARVINVSSVAHKFYDFDTSDVNFKKPNAGERYFEIYSASKLANVLFTKELANKLNRACKSVTVNSLHPGVVQTEFGRFLPNFMQVLGPILAGIYTKSAKQGAQTSIYLAVASEVENVTGKYFSDCKEAKPSKLAQDEGLAKKLWEISEELVHLKPEERHF